ncbi:MAG TPA: universal stress protein [Gemmatimonadaceae bacterium]|nr:universal stress protein [Gemmatimonadaceae bacterium]
MSAGSILVPLDGSDKDARALAIALALAELSGAELHLVHVLDQHAHDDSDSIAQRTAERRLEERAGELAVEQRARISWAISTGGDVADELVRHAEERDALLVVMGTRAPTVVGRVIAGSVADRVMRECTRPVVLVPPGTAYMAGKRIRFGRVLVPLDGSGLAERALDFLLRLPHANALEYVLLTVVPPGPESRLMTGAADSDDARAPEMWLEEVAARARAHGLTAVETQVVEAADPSRIIAEAVREYLVEMIAMSTRGAGGLRRLVLGSVAEGVVRASEVPVLLLTPATLARTHNP